MQAQLTFDSQTLVQLIDFLRNHEDDIARSVDDYFELWHVYTAIFSATPLAQKKQPTAEEWLQYHSVGKSVVTTTPLQRDRTEK